MKKIRVLICLSLVLIISFSLSLQSYAATLEVDTYLSSSSTTPIFGITKGPDGNIWFTKTAEHQVAKITPAGIVTAYNLPDNLFPAFGITSGPDGNLWLTAGTSDPALARRILKISTSGDLIANYDLTSSLQSYPNYHDGLTAFGITSGPDGNLWVNIGGVNSTEGGYIARITPSGNISTYPISNGGFGITSGPDGNLWYTMGSSVNSINKIGKITPSGQVTEYPLPGTGDGTFGITSGPDGNLWYTRSPASSAPAVGKITPSGQVTEYPVTPNSFIYYGLAAGPDGRIWFSESSINKLAAIDMQGNISEYEISAGAPLSLAVGPDGNLWFALLTADSGGKIARITPPASNTNGNNSETPKTIASITPTAPKTGLVLNTIIFTTAVVSVIFPVVFEYRRDSKRNKSSSH